MIFNDVNIFDYERIDDLHRNGYLIIQDPKKFCFGQDAVLLSAFAKVSKGHKVLDIGTGTGIIPILLEAKTDCNHFTGLEIQAESVDMAKRSVQINNLSDKISIVQGDIKDFNKLFSLSSFDVITSNPPYMNEGGGLVNPHSPKAIARHEILCSLNDIVEASSKLLKPQCSFYMIHRPHRLTDILISLRQHKLEPKTLRYVYPYIDKEPTMVLIEAVRGGKAMLKNLPPLIIYNSDGKYTDEIYKIYYE